MPSQTKENYLKAIYMLANEHGEIGMSVLSKEMGVSIPTANSMVKKLQEYDWVVYQKYKPLLLTAKGEKTAALIIRKHRLSEMYLVEKMGFGWEEVHDIAEQLEHVHADTFFDRIDELLGNPEVDPHGSPIPDKNGNLILKKYSTLGDLETGQKVKLCALKESSKEFLSYLNAKHIRLGIEIEIIALEPFDGSMTVSYENFGVQILSKLACDRLWVELL